jgi:hypothetical protein
MEMEFQIGFHMQSDKMKLNKMLIVGIAAIAIVIVLAFYLIPKPQPAFTEISCFTYYHFTSNYFENVRSEKISFNSGENATFFYTVKNPYKAPITDASIRVQILYNGNDVARAEGDDIVDEFFVVKNLNLLLGDSYSGEFSWSIPAEIKPGTYKANFFLISEDKIYLSGASFIQKVPGVSVTFIVKSDGDEFLHFVRANSLLNNAKYTFEGLPKSFTDGSSITVKADLLNEGGRKDDVQITYQVFEFDDMLPAEEIKSLTKTETISFDANEEKSVDFVLPNLPVNSYLIKLTANSGTQKSILKLKVPISGEKGTFVYLSLQDFPIATNISGIVCLTNIGAESGSMQSFNGILKIQVQDNDGQTIFEKEGNVGISGDVDGYAFNFDSPKVATQAKLIATIYDSQSTLQDSMEINYDSANFIGSKKNLDAQVISIPSSDGDNLVFQVNYNDKYGNPVRGNILSLISDSSGKVVATIHEHEIFGMSQEKTSWLPLLKGTYTLKVIDQTAGIEVMRNFVVS